MFRSEMPSSKANADECRNFLPEERENDFEYNLLLCKFKSLYSKLKNFEELHRGCSVSLSEANPSNNNNNEYLCNSLNNSGNLSSSIRNNAPASNAQIPTIPFSGSQFQPQSSVPAGFANPRKEASTTISQLRSSNNVLAGNQSCSKRYNSSHNLLLSSDPQNPAPSSRSNVWQRPLVENCSLISKSSERLNAIPNNGEPQKNAPIKDKLDLTLKSIQVSPPIARDQRYLENDANIYDAPDDTLSPELGNRPSMNNLSRLSLDQRSKREVLHSTKGASFDAGLGLPNSPPRTLAASKSSPLESRDIRTHGNNSYSSSNILDASCNTLSSQSMLNSYNKADLNESPHYANYVNIDFFLKRGRSPSVDDLDDELTNDDLSDASDEETTNMTHSLSSDHLCEEALRDMSPRELAKKLSTKVTTNSSSSLTPASSGDFLDERNPSVQPSSSTFSRFNEANHRLASFFSNASRDSDKSAQSRSMISGKDSDSNINTKNLGPIHENCNSFISTKRNTSLDQSLIEGKDKNAFAEARSTMRSFLSDLNLSPVDDMFEDKAQRRIVKESFAVEFCGRRKLRHLFLFNDVIVCAKYQASSKQKFTFDVKWYLNLNGITVLDPSDVNNQVKYDKEAMENQILAIRTNLMLLRGQMQHIKRSKRKPSAKVVKKLRKKQTELEADLVLLLPHLPLVIKHSNSKKYTFFLSSNFDRNQWIESIRFLQSQLNASKMFSETPSSSELQAWIETCRKNLNPSLGTFLLRSNCDDDLLYGDLYITLTSVNGVTKEGNYYFCFEVDSYGHFSQKISSSVSKIDRQEHPLNDEYIIPLDGAHTLRILLYESLGLASKPSIVGKAHIELSRAWLIDKPVDKAIVFNSNCHLTARLSYCSSELLSMRISHAKLCPTFGMDITQVCKKEKTHVPLLIQLCVNEVERRGMREVGIYRMSGTSTDVQRLKKAFETNPYAAELLLRDIDINSVTGFLKTYLREMPEGLFINKLFLKFVAAFNIPQSDSFERTKKMLELFNKMPVTNQHTIIYLIEHLVKVNRFENFNKMSLSNLATIIGPNILRPPSDSSETFTAVVIGSILQAGILYFFLNRKYMNLPLTDMDQSELIKAKT